MIRFPPIYLHRPINLLHQHQAHELMRQRHAPEAEPLLRAAQDRIGEPVAASDDKHDMARPVGAEPVDLRGKLLRAPELAVNGEGDHMRALLHMREDTFALARLHARYLGFAQGIGRFFIRYLNHLELEVGRQALGIFLDALHQILLLQFADRNELN